jgi:hypothetical protein
LDGNGNGNNGGRQRFKHLNVAGLKWLRSGANRALREDIDAELRARSVPKVEKKPKRAKKKGKLFGRRRRK